jgi:outer membrane immunogenic protein
MRTIGAARAFRLGVCIVLRKRFWIFATAAALAFCNVSSSQADDIHDGLADFSAAPDARDWNGVYLGGNFGYGFGHKETSDISVFTAGGAPIPTFAPLTYALDPDGVFGGGQLGFNVQSGRLVFGVEADIEKADISGSSLTVFANPGSPNNIAPFGYDASASVDWFGTVRGRLGYACDRTLFYVTGGLAYGHVDYSATYEFLPLGPGQSFGLASASGFETGYVIGGGLEHAFDANWSLKLEYQYIDLGSKDVTGQLFFANGTASGETFKTSVDSEFHTIRVGLNYRFGDRPEPATSLK